ncbi:MULTISPECIES: DUF2752 domain-containing protein [unclassified Streptomyces]|uniref:DUF2752 domain-containing protein n=1 Tax=unclassified Streptomyces TaxID=2593676 RepID=UPI00380958C5
MRDVTADPRSVTPPAAPPAAVPRGAAAGVPRRVAVPAALLAAVAGAFAYVGAVDPNEAGHYPTCPLYAYTGLLCPGCGGLRGAHALVHGDLPAALHANAMAVAAYAGLAVLWTVWVVRAARGRSLRVDPAPVHLWLLGAFLLLFTVVRNLPFGGWFRP